MTDEELRETCKALRNGNAHYWKAEWYNELADEIERLAAELDETRKKLTSAEIQRDDWKFERLI